MKLKRILATPLAIAADVVTLGNFGERTHTQRLFDAERREQQDKQTVQAVALTIALIKALRK